MCEWVFQSCSLQSLLHSFRYDRAGTWRPNQKCYFGKWVEHFDFSTKIDHGYSSLVLGLLGELQKIKSKNKLHIFNVLDYMLNADKWMRFLLDCGSVCMTGVDLHLYFHEFSEPITIYTFKAVKKDVPFREKPLLSLDFTASTKALHVYVPS